MSEVQIVETDGTHPDRAPSPAVAAAESKQRTGRGFENLEKFGRFLLWTTLAAVCIIIPIEYTKSQARSFESEQKRAQLELEAERAKGPRRLTYSSMGQALVGTRDGDGYLTFSNVSARSGVVCVIGIVKSAKSERTSSSLASCENISAYQSGVQLKVSFARREYKDLCPNDDCEIIFRDAPESDVQVVASR